MRLFVQIKGNLIIVLYACFTLSFTCFCNGINTIGIEQFMNNDNYFIVDIDINKDGILDKVVSSRKYKGNELYFFINKENIYKFAVKSINFSEDGGRIVGDIIPSQNKNEVLSIQTYFPDRGKDKATYYISYINKIWVLNKIEYETNNPIGDYTKTYICSVTQNVSLTELNCEPGLKKIKNIPNENMRDSLCDIKYYFEDDLKDFIKRFNENNRQIFNDITRYDALLEKFPIDQHNLTEYNNIGYYLEHLGLYEESAYLLKLIVKKFPNRTVAYINLGDAYWGLKETEKAKEAYQKYIELMKTEGKEAKIPKRVLERVK